MKLYNKLLFIGVQMGVISIFNASLNMDSASGCKSFFELGGDSLQAVDCVIAIEKKYRLDFHLEDLLLKTAADLAVNITRSGCGGVIRNFLDVACGGWVLITGKDQ